LNRFQNLRTKQPEHKLKNK